MMRRVRTGYRGKEKPPPSAVANPDGGDDRRNELIILYPASVLLSSSLPADGGTLVRSVHYSAIDMFATILFLKLFHCCQL
jgi:hypothetical protein